jgi:manganese/zinc/iron transport system substrate-binding protein
MSKKCRRRGGWIGGALLALLLLAGCQGDRQTETGKLRVVATTGLIGDAVRQVAGDQVELDVLMGPGVDPHLFSASEGDVARLQQADLIFYNGLLLEAQLASVLQRLGERKPAVAVAEQLDPDLLLDAGVEGEFDPHLWFDLTLWQQVVEVIADQLAAADPANAASYQSNASAYQAELATLHAYVLDRTASIPARQRILVTAHDAFRYFGRAYGFEVHGLQGTSTVAEAGTADLRALADLIVQKEVPAIFVENSVPVRTVEAVQAAVRDRGHQVVLGGELYSDALGAPDSDGATYVGLIRHNIDTIAAALRGKGSEDGEQ